MVLLEGDERVRRLSEWGKGALSLEP